MRFSQKHQDQLCSALRTNATTIQKSLKWAVSGPFSTAQRHVLALKAACQCAMTLRKIGDVAVHAVLDREFCKQVTAAASLARGAESAQKIMSHLTRFEGLVCGRS